MPAPSNFDAQLEASLRRIAGALKQNRSQYASMVEQIMAATTADVVQRVDAKTQRVAARIAERHERQMEDWQRREERRERRRQRRRELEARGDAGDIPRGIVFAVIAVVCATLALRDPPLFWMVFVALGFGMSAVSAFTRALRRGDPVPETEAETTEAAGEAATVKPGATAAATTPPPPPAVAEPPDPKVVRIQTLCDKLLAELESGPPIVREVVTEPQATIGGLRQACLETARRERELRSVLASQDEAGLMAERDALAARLSSEKDAIVHERLGQALRALQEQLAHRAELATTATRLEAENMRILYTLENVHMQLLRARSTDIGAPELGGKLRDSLRELGTQIDAVAEALEIASTPASVDVQPPAVPSTDLPAAVTAASTDDRERAERGAAARRAEQARQSRRQ